MMALTGDAVDPRCEGKRASWHTTLASMPPLSAYWPVFSSTRMICHPLATPSLSNAEKGGSKFL